MKAPGLLFALTLLPLLTADKKKETTQVLELPKDPPLAITAETRKEMKKILSEIQSGQFAKQWIGENKDGRGKFLAMRAEQADQPVENVGRELRKMMTFLKRNKEAGVPVA